MASFILRTFSPWASASAWRFSPLMMMTHAKLTRKSRKSRNFDQLRARPVPADVGSQTSNRFFDTRHTRKGFILTAKAPCVSPSPHLALPQHSAWPRPSMPPLPWHSAVLSAAPPRWASGRLVLPVSGHYASGQQPAQRGLVQTPNGKCCKGARAASHLVDATVFQRDVHCRWRASEDVCRHCAAGCQERGLVEKAS